MLREHRESAIKKKKKKWPRCLSVHTQWQNGVEQYFTSKKYIQAK